jgi:hypothetical protein
LDTTKLFMAAWQHLVVAVLHFTCPSLSTSIPFIVFFIGFPFVVLIDHTYVLLVLHFELVLSVFHNYLDNMSRQVQCVVLLNLFTNHLVNEMWIYMLVAA